MANRHQGKSTLEINGTAYTLSYSIDALCRMEDEACKGGQTVTTQDISERAGRGDVRAVRLMFFAALLDHHPDLTLKRAGELILEAGGIAVIAAALRAVLGSTEPDPADIEAVGARPRKARQRSAAGTGASSSATDAPQG